MIRLYAPRRCAPATTLRTVFSAAIDVQVVVTRVLLDDDQGAAEWTWSETSRADGRRYTIEDAIVFDLRDDQILCWREYFDTASFSTL
jgi:ketosteroid isomerase-like protein